MQAPAVLSIGFRLEWPIGHLSPELKPIKTEPSLDPALHLGSWKESIGTEITLQLQLIHGDVHQVYKSKGSSLVRAGGFVEVK